MSVELVQVGNQFFIIEGGPGAYELFRCRLDHVASHARKYELRAMARGGVVTDRFELVDGVLVGVLGYHRGERLDVVRRPDGSVGHLVCATFVYTRTPYDPDVDVPGR